MEFIYNKSILNTTSMITMSVADLRDLIQAFSIANESQKFLELKKVLGDIGTKNRLIENSISVHIKEKI